MRRSAGLWLVIVLIILSPVSITNAETSRQDALIIAFVSGHDAGGYRLNDTSGFSRFTSLINNAGGVVREISLNEAISSDIDVLILHGPKTPELSSAEVARIWSFLDHGGNLLIMNDPPPNRGLSERNALNELLWHNYGIRWRDVNVVEPYFGSEAYQAISQRGFRLQPRRLSGLSAEALNAHPITQLLAKYDTPVYYWHARTLELQAPALQGSPLPLLQTTGQAFGDARLPRDGLPVLNIGQDPQGILTLGAAVEDIHSGARIVVLTDSDLFKNGYGLEYVNNQNGLPAFPGNDLLARSIIRWLLERPLDDLILDSRYVWLAVDGDSSDWTSNSPPFITGDERIPEVQVLRTDRQYYINMQVIPDLSNINHVEVQFQDSSGTTNRLVINRGLSNFNEINLGDLPTTKAVAGDEIVEISIPLNMLPRSFTINELCVVTSNRADCIPTNFTLVASSGLELRGSLLLPNVPSARVNPILGLSMYNEPLFESRFLTELSFSDFVNVISFNENGEWAQIWTDGLIGWVQTKDLQLAFSEEVLAVPQIIDNSEDTPSNLPPIGPE